MASEVDICNLALSHLGDNANVASLDPPEGSAQAQQCATYYPVARNTLLEMHDWGFATTRINPARRQGQWLGWDYAFAKPAGAIRIISVKPANACQDETMPSVPYLSEMGANGVGIILCNTPDIVVRYTAMVTDTNRFSPLFVVSLSWYLASMLAGPILKGATGAAEAKRCAQVAQAYVLQAATSDANQNHTVQTTQPHAVPWLAVR